MSIKNEEKNVIKDINNKSPENSKKIISPIKSSPNNTKKEKKKRNRKKKNEKSIKLKNNNSTENNFSGGILSEIKQISIPSELSEKENLFKILQSEIISIDKSISLLTKKKKYYNEISQKLNGEIQNEKKNLKKNEVKNKEYLYMENLLKDYNINDTFDCPSYIENNSYYNINKNINKSLDYNYFLLNQENYKNFLMINFFDEKNKNQINNKMEPNYQLSYEEFNNISELDNNFCLLMSNNIDNNSYNIIIDKKEEDLNIVNNNNELNNINDNKIICDSEEENKEKNKTKDKDKSNSNNNYENKIEVEDGEFTIIDEAPPEEEETNNKKKKKISVEKDMTNNSKIKEKDNISDNKEIKGEKDIDRSINKNYSNSLEELDFYLLKDSRKKDKKENKKKKITFEDIQKKYKTQEMGTDFIRQEEISDNINSSSPEEEKIIVNKKKQKQKKINNKSISVDSNKNEESENNQDCNDKEDKFYCDDSSEISKDKEEINGNKKKKRGRKKKKKDLKLTFSLEEELPDPENMDSIALALEMKKYGMKPQNKKRNVEILKSIYNFFKIKELPENISHKLATFDLDNDEDNNSESNNENKIKSKNKEGVSRVTELNEEQKKKIIEIIKENKTIYEKILLFKEISIKEIKTLINSKGIIAPNHLLSQLLINSGVILPGGWNDKK